MADTADDLSTPLGQRSRVSAGSGCPLPLTAGDCRVAGTVLVAFLGFAIFNNNPLGGEPVARVAIRHTAATENKPQRPPHTRQQPGSDAAADAAQHAATAGQKTITIIDGSSGTRQDVVVSGDGSDKADGDAAPAMMAGSISACWRNRATA